MAKLHPIILAVGRDQIFPDWAVMSEARRQHALRVGRLLWKWSRKLDHRKKKRIRWRAAGLLHDALKGESPAVLRRQLPDAAEWSDPLLHGPVCAARLREEGVSDKALLRAVAYHTTGHPKFSRLGQALYMADYLDPGRRGMVRTRADWRRRMPDDWDSVLEEVAASKISTLLDRRVPIPAVAADFWRDITTRD